MLAPWFGASTIVWANTIAMVLVALSIGYAIGGRFADRDPTTPPGRPLRGRGLSAAGPGAVRQRPVPAPVDAAVDQLSRRAFVGSLVGVGVLIAVPVLLLGMVSPYAVRL